MVVDSSALVALLLGEPSASDVATAMADAGELVISAATLVEVTMVVESRLGAAGVLRLDQVLREAGVATFPVDEADARLAIDAWRTFGKGRHPAELNFGDVFSYALARRRADVLLCVGDDFSRADVPTMP